MLCTGCAFVFNMEEAPSNLLGRVAACFGVLEWCVGAVSIAGPGRYHSVDGCRFV